MFPNPVDDERMYIIELSNTDVRLIAQLLHIHLHGEGNHRLGYELLHKLMTQTDIVNKEPWNHGVHDHINSAMTAVQTNQIWHVPLDP